MINHKCIWVFVFLLMCNFASCEENPKSVVIGAGPVGYFATTVLLIEGHDVTLVEKKDEPTKIFEADIGYDVIVKLLSMTNLPSYCVKNVNFIFNNSDVDNSDVERIFIAIMGNIAQEDNISPDDQDDYIFFKKLFIEGGRIRIKDLQLYQQRKINEIIKTGKVTIYNLDNFDKIEEKTITLKSCLVKKIGFKATNVDTKTKEVQLTKQGDETTSIIKFDNLIIADGFGRSTLEHWVGTEKPKVVDLGSQPRCEGYATAVFEFNNIEDLPHNFLEKINEKKMKICGHYIPNTMQGVLGKNTQLISILGEIKSKTISCKSNYHSETIRKDIDWNDFLLACKIAPFDLVSKLQKGFDWKYKYPPMFTWSINFENKEIYVAAECPESLTSEKITEWMKVILCDFYKKIGVDEKIFNPMVASKKYKAQVFNLHLSHLDKNYVNPKTGGIIVFVGDTAVSSNLMLDIGIEVGMSDVVNFIKILDDKGEFTQLMEEWLEQFHKERIVELGSYTKAMNSDLVELTNHLYPMGLKISTSDTASESLD